MQPYKSYFSRHRGQIARFGLVGIITFILNYAMVWLFYGLIALNYRVAVSFAYIITVCAHFMLNRTFVYNKGGSTLFSHLGKYGGMLLINYLTTLAISMGTVEVCRLTPYYGVLFATGGTAFSSFLLMKYFVFRDCSVDSQRRDQLRRLYRN